MIATKDTLVCETVQTARALHSVGHFLVRRKFPRLVLEHDGNAVPNRKCEVVGLADKLALRLAVNERPLTDRTDENFKQASVHECVAE